MIMIFIIIIGVGFIMGMYVSSQIETHVRRRTQNKDLINNINKMNTTSKEGNISHNYTYIKKEEDDN
tara:strand:- start:288 stop:488 length:201 start_codon:yes stop_codon:yes gene_type:complete